jgi:hypothetical protein
MRKTQPGYGVPVPDEFMRRNLGPAKDDGFYLTDTKSGKKRLLVSIDDLLTKAEPPVGIENREAQEIYGFHSKFNPQGDLLMVSLRWFPEQPEGTWNMFKISHNSVRFAWITVPVNGGPMHCSTGPEQWEKGGHHATWLPNGRQISMNLNIDREVLRFVQVDADGKNLKKIFDDVTGSGHPTIHKNGTHLLTDTYTHEKTSFGDGTIPLRWIDLRTGEEEVVVRINTETPYRASDSTLRVDPHPAWDRSWRYVVFNAFIDGTRRIFIADMEGKI